MKSKFINICVFVLIIFQGGCAVDKIAGKWCDSDIDANGNDKEWQGVPQYYDEDRQLVVRLLNNAEALFVCVAISDAALVRQLQMGGMTVWFDPKGGEDQVFGIHLPGSGIKRHEWRSQPEHGELKAPDDGDRQLKKEQRPPPVEPPNGLEITYKNATEPVEMSIAEAQRTGIHVGVGQTRVGRQVYEFDIKLAAAVSLSGLKPGMPVGIGIEGGEFKPQDRKMTPSGGPMGSGGHPPGGPGGGMDKRNPGGGMGGGPGGPHRGKQISPFKVWLQFQLANHPVQG